jgi:ribosomal protein L10
MEAIRNLPTRAEAVAMIVHVIGSPLQDFVGVLAGVLQNFLGVLDAIIEKKKAAGEGG